MLVLCMVQAHDRVTRLYDVYCKFVLPFAMLSEAEKEQAQKDVHRQYELSSAEEDAILKVTMSWVVSCTVSICAIG